MTEAAGTQGGIIPPGTSASTVTIYCHNFLLAPQPLRSRILHSLPPGTSAASATPPRWRKELVALFLFRRIRSSGTGLPSRSVVDVAFPSSRHPSRFSGSASASARFASGRSKQRSRRPEHSAGRANAARNARSSHVAADEITWEQYILEKCPCRPVERHFSETQCSQVGVFAVT